MEKENKIIKQCEIYKSNAACLCYECNNYFCEVCFKLIHDRKMILNIQKKIMIYLSQLNSNTKNTLMKE